MAVNLWGKIYFKDAFAGILSQEAGNRYTFTYDTTYLENPTPAIAFTLPKREEPFVHENGLHPFFDNLAAEGWLKNAQARALGVRQPDRFELLLAFGMDCAGAVSIIDPKPAKEVKINLSDTEDVAALTGRASLSGIQPKIMVVREGKTFRPIKRGETSTYIAKLPSPTFADLLENEMLATIATRVLLRGDDIVEMDLGELPGIAEKALIVRRFDRTATGEKIHFEEFTQLLGLLAEEKYDGDYDKMGAFILENNDACIKTDAEKLYRRILVCLLTGNTDAHFKNFAMFHAEDGLRLTPAYDLVAASLYRKYQTLALGIKGARDLRIGDIKAKHIARLGQRFALPAETIMLAIEDFEKRLPRAKEAVSQARNIPGSIKENLINQMERRWNGTFASTGRYLSARQ